MKQNLLPIIALIIASLAAILAVGLMVYPKVQTQLGGATFAATFGEANATSTQITVGGNGSFAVTSSTNLWTSDARRAYWIVCNESATDTVWLSFTKPATVGQGILLNPMGSSTQSCFEMKYPVIDNGNIYGITTPSSTVPISFAAGNAL